MRILFVIAMLLTGCNTAKKIEHCAVRCTWKLGPWTEAVCKDLCRNSDNPGKAFGGAE